MEQDITKTTIDIIIFTIKVIHFYDFYTNVLNCIPIFLEHTKTTKSTITDDELCVICCERKNNLILKCLVFLNKEAHLLRELYQSLAY